eukprot:TRINITY_DN8626_c0_g1_i2.p1 TRINITY_DN8626_c0_g1~~TRINITY_DN8626_c0_g1_i2.p1  ORF type:complete len:522 (+),score=80.68 TRINITY_DN8626_c0_g1_i2:632-2197(+)
MIETEVVPGKSQDVFVGGSMADVWSGILSKGVSQGGEASLKAVQRCKTEKAIHLWADVSSSEGTPADRRQLVKNVSLPSGLRAQQARPLSRRMSFFSSTSVGLGLGWTETFAVIEDNPPADSASPCLSGVSALPDRCLVTIMSFISDAEEWVKYKLVCKRWCRLANEALRALQIRDLKPLNGQLLVEALHHFGNLASLQLHISRPGVVSDTLLGCIAAGCPQVKSLHLAYREDTFGFDAHKSPRSGLSPRVSSEMPRAATDPRRFAVGAEWATNDEISRGRQAVTGAGFDLLFTKCWQLKELTIAAMSPTSWLAAPAPGSLVVPSSLGNLSDLSALALHLPGCTSLPSTLGDLTNLVELSLACERLKALPESLGNLSSLSTLDLSRCHSLEHLPESLGSLSSLKTLLLNECRSLQELPPSIGQLSSLTTLKSQDCQALCALPDEIVRLDRLETLDLDGCLSLSSLPEDIGRLTRLSSLEAENCPSLTEVPESVECLVRLSAAQMCALLGLASHPFGVPVIR